MKIVFNRYPIDIVLFIVWGIILLPVVLLNTNEIFRIIIGIPFLFFITGYMLVFLLFPTKAEYNGIKGIERIGLSIGFSIAIVSIVGFLLNYTPWKIRLEPILLSLFFIVETLGLIALYRWKMTAPNQRFTISLDVSPSKSDNKIEKVLTILVIFSIFIAGASIFYIIAIPKVSETFTDFYLISSNRNLTDYPQFIYAGENTSVVLGLINHEYKIMNYTIEVWLINESVIFNESTQKNDTIYNQAWFMDEIVVTLNHTDVTNEKSQTKKWEYNYTFTVNKKYERYKLTFLLFTTPSEGYDSEQDYKDSINLRIKNAYRALHLWLYVA